MPASSSVPWHCRCWPSRSTRLPAAAAGSAIARAVHRLRVRCLPSAQPGDDGRAAGASRRSGESASTSAAPNDPARSPTSPGPGCRRSAPGLEAVPRLGRPAVALRGRRTSITSSRRPMRQRSDKAFREATRAARTAAALGLAKGSTLFLDIESYDNSVSSCNQPVLNYVSGWNSRLKALGWKGAMYSSAATGIRSIDNIKASRLQPLHASVRGLVRRGRRQTQRALEVPPEQLLRAPAGEAVRDRRHADLRLGHPRPRSQLHRHRRRIGGTEAATLVRSELGLRSLQDPAQRQQRAHRSRLRSACCVVPTPTAAR